MPEPTCRFCRSPLSLSLVDLGSMPLANALVRPERAGEPDPVFPLHARVCEQCYLVQVDDVVPPEEIFGDYTYFSSYAQTWLDHAREFCRMATETLDLDKESFVVEVASNDGYLLKNFVEAGIPALGIEPAANVADVAEVAGVTTVVTFFGSATADDLADEHGRADLIIANNVLAHVPDLNDFVEGFARLVKPTGVITVEVPHLLRLIDQVAFDTIYHEHYSYFSLFTLEKLFAAHDLEIFDVEELPTHGGSLRLWIAPRDAARALGANVLTLRAMEHAWKVDAPERYVAFSAVVDDCRRGFGEFMEEQRRAGSRVAAYGAAAKGITFLNFCGVTTDDIPYAVDKSPHKQGLLLPGSRLPVLSPDHVREDRPDLLLVLPWNLRDEVMEQMADVRAWGGRFLTAVPTMQTYP